ncbi:MAG: TetR/AcrR family transcriptional regulator [Dermatophilaceae bacterium]|nr:TetR/AcrR family transcriptional regulator [Dermatophilaceae bacterium]
MEKVKAPTGGTRRYRSMVREESARQTRRTIVVAATRLFEEKGYGGTSLAEVAAAAGVARPTVTAAFGTKPALLSDVLDEALAGDDEPVPVAERPWFRPVWDARRPGEVLAAYATVCTLIGQRAARLFEVVRRAADASPEVAELWDRSQRNRRAGSRMVVDQLEVVGVPAGWPGHAKAVDALWFFNDPSHYDALVRQCGWPEREFTEWLAQRMSDALLRP